MLTVIIVSKLPRWAGECSLKGDIRRRWGQKKCQFQIYTKIKFIAGNYPEEFQRFSIVNGVQHLVVHGIPREFGENCVLSQENVQPLHTARGRQLFFVFHPHNSRM